MSGRSGAGAQWRGWSREVRLAFLCACAAVPLTGCGDNSLRANATITQADSADQVLDSVYHVVTKQGMRQSIVEADTAYYYESGKVFELRHLRITFFSTTGAQSSVLTATEGTYQMALGQMEARGTVVVRSNDGRQLNTDLLKYDQGLNQLSTDRPFTFSGPTANGSGVGFVSDPDFRDVTVTSGARGRERGTGGSGFVIPGQ